MSAATVASKSKIRNPIPLGPKVLRVRFLRFAPFARRTYIGRVSILAFLLSALVAYLIGSVPTGFLVGKARGIDIRNVGSGNIGATNVFRALGRTAGILVLLADALKGWLAVAVVSVLAANWLFPSAGALTRDWLRIEAGFCAILGHNYTCWLHFKGGKGIATSAGVLAALVPYALLCILALWFVVLAVSRYVSLASICASAMLPVAAWLTGSSLALIAMSGAMAVLAIYKHKTNIQRLLRGTENRFGPKSSAVTPKSP